MTIISKLTALVDAAIELSNAIHACVEMARETSERQRESHRNWLATQGAERAELARMREFARWHKESEEPAPEGLFIVCRYSEKAPASEYSHMRSDDVSEHWEWRFARLEDVPEVASAKE